MSQDIKIFTSGESGTGKTCFLKKEQFHTFFEGHTITIGPDLFRLKYYRDGREYNIQVWDTAGEIKFRSVPKSTYRTAHGVIFFYDVTTRESLEAVEKIWHEEVMTYSNRKELIKVVVGNKIDLEDERKVSREEGQQLATRLSASFFETSARSGENVHRAIVDCIERVTKTSEYQEEIAPKESRENINLTETNLFTY